jgi:hypothetical protein
MPIPRRPSAIGATRITRRRSRRTRDRCREYSGGPAGETRICRVVRVPTRQEEDTKRQYRERNVLISERIAHSNRMKGLLMALEIRNTNPTSLRFCRPVADVSTAFANFRLELGGQRGLFAADAVAPSWNGGRSVAGLDIAADPIAEFRFAGGAMCRNTDRASFEKKVSTLRRYVDALTLIASGDA